MAAHAPDLNFTSREEFREICRQLSNRLHYLNRVAMGEQAFAWEMADLLSRAGRVFDEHYQDEAVLAAFGDGWTHGTLKKEELPAALFGLLYPELSSDGS